MSDILDVVVIGAGLSGIGAACHLKRNCPERKIAILEARERSGGTWDLFRYPGIRSDSDMHTLGYSFKPWEDSKAIADGPSILSYVRETAKEYGVDSLIRYQQKVKQANWDSEEQCWELSTTTVMDISRNFPDVTHLRVTSYTHSFGLKIWTTTTNVC
jgi:cation diffusion facilitator CzcD-associated flavoprotein CzcO